MNVDDPNLMIDYYDNASPGDSYRVVCRITHRVTGVRAMSEEHQSRLVARREAMDRFNARGNTCTAPNES